MNNKCPINFIECYIDFFIDLFWCETSLAISKEEHEDIYNFLTNIYDGLCEYGDYGDFFISGYNILLIAGDDNEVMCFYSRSII